MKFHKAWMLPAATNVRINSAIHKTLAWLSCMAHTNIHLFLLSQKVKYFAKFKGVQDFYFLSQRLINSKTQVKHTRKKALTTAQPFSGTTIKLQLNVRWVNSFTTHTPDTRLSTSNYYLKLPPPLKNNSRYRTYYHWSPRRIFWCCHCLRVTSVASSWSWCRCSRKLSCPDTHNTVNLYSEIKVQFKCYYIRWNCIGHLHFISAAETGIQAQHEPAVCTCSPETNPMLGCIKRSITSRSREGNLPLCFTLMRPYLQFSSRAPNTWWMPFGITEHSFWYAPDHQTWPEAFFLWEWSHHHFLQNPALQGIYPDSQVHYKYSLAYFWGDDAFFLVQAKIHISFILKTFKFSDTQTYLLSENNFCHLSWCTSELEEAEIQFGSLGLCLEDTKRKEIICG